MLASLVVVGSNNDNSASSAGIETYSAHLSYPLFRDGSILGLNTAPAEARNWPEKKFVLDE